MASQDVIIKWLNFPGVNRAWVATQLFGEKSVSNTAKLSNKAKGNQGRTFTDHEWASLGRIYQEYMAGVS